MGFSVRSVRTTDHFVPKRVGFRLREFAVAVYQLNVNNAQWTTQKASLWLGDGWREFIAACNKITRKNTKKVFLEGFR